MIIVGETEQGVQRRRSKGPKKPWDRISQANGTTM